MECRCRRSRNYNPVAVSAGRWGLRLFEAPQRPKGTYNPGWAHPSGTSGIYIGPYSDRDRYTLPVTRSVTLSTF